MGIVHDRIGPTGIDEILETARRRIHRVAPDALEYLIASGGLIIDIRPAAQREVEGALPGALVVERNVLEWRFDLLGAHHLPQITGYDQIVVVVCSEGYASSLAADSLRALGYSSAADLTGGYQAWRATSLR